MDITALREACKGTVAAAGEANFTELLHENLWNRLIPARSPQVLVRVEDEQDVIAAIHFARAHKLKVAIRGGGHNWCQPTLRNGGLLIDLSRLDQVISIDAEARKAVVQPIISNRDAQRALNAHGMAFPSGHCPQVKLSGYLLGGGMSWNQGVWGHGCESVEAIELVTAQGELITASAHENCDYFWAARGAGSGFFGVVTRYHLRLHPLPKAMHACHTYYPIEEAAALGSWLSEIAGQLAPSVELSLFLVEAPEDHAAIFQGKVCLVTGASFADSPEQALAELAPLATGPIFAKNLFQAPAAPVTFEQLFDASGALWPEHLRNRVEAIFSDADGGELAQSVGAHFVEAPSAISLILFVFFTGPVAPLPDIAFSMNARIYGGPWTMWREPAEDAANTAWHRGVVERLSPFVSGRYVGESDTVSRPGSAGSAFRPENWKRLSDLRAKYDPDGIFFDYSDGLTETTTS